MADTITYFAQTDARNKRVPFGIKSNDRTKHVYVIGKTGMGKSTLLENMAVQDIKNGEGFAFIDPHGKTAELLLEYIPEERIKDVIYFAPFDTDHPISFNVMEDVGYDKRHLVVSGLMSAFKKIWLEAWSARMEYILTNTLLALLEYPDATLLGVNRMYTDKEYRKKVVENIKDPSVKSFWVDEFTKYTDRYTQDATPAIQNKVGQFTANPLIRNIIGQPKSSFDFRKVIDERKILIINLSKGRIGESNANLLGSMLITKIYLAAMSRADIHDREMQKLPNFYLYVDEFQSFANESFADILSEARKYKLNLTIAHQYVEQMSEEVRAAVFGNVGTMIMFRVGAFDAETLEKEFAPAFEAEDMVNLGIYQVYLKLMIDGVASHPFSATTLPPILLPEKSSREQVMENSRKFFSQPRPEVEEAIRIWYQPVIPPKSIMPVKSSLTAPVSDLPAARLPATRRQATGTAQAGVAQSHEKSHPAPKPSHTPLESHPPEEWSKKTEPKRPTPISLDSLKTKSPGMITQERHASIPSKNISGLKEALKEVLGVAKKHENKVILPATLKTTSQPIQPHTEAVKQQPVASSDEQKKNEIPEDELRKMLHVDK